MTQRQPLRSPGRLGEAAESGRLDHGPPGSCQGGRAETGPSKLPALSCSPSKAPSSWPILDWGSSLWGLSAGFEHSSVQPSSRRKGQLRDQALLFLPMPGVFSWHHQNWLKTQRGSTPPAQPTGECDRDSAVSALLFTSQRLMTCPHATSRTWLSPGGSVCSGEFMWSPDGFSATEPRQIAWEPPGITQRGRTGDGSVSRLQIWLRLRESCFCFRKWRFNDNGEICMEACGKHQMLTIIITYRPSP